MNKIEFTPSEIKSIIEGEKTQIRRIIDPQPPSRYDRLYLESGADYGWWWSKSTSGEGSSQQDLMIFPKHDFKKSDVINISDNINLKITNIRVDRVQNISQSDCIAEGLEFMPTTMFFDLTIGSRFEEEFIKNNGPDSWSDNPWVWVIEFEKFTS